MKSKIILSTALAAALSFMAPSSSARAFSLLDRMMGHSSCGCASKCGSAVQKSATQKNGCGPKSNGHVQKNGCCGHGKTNGHVQKNGTKSPCQKSRCGGHRLFAGIFGHGCKSKCGCAKSPAQKSCGGKTGGHVQKNGCKSPCQKSRCGGHQLFAGIFGHGCKSKCGCTKSPAQKCCGGKTGGHVQKNGCCGHGKTNGHVQKGNGVAQK